MEPPVKLSIKRAFQDHLQARYSLRVHMALILLATILSGLLFSKLLLLVHLYDFRWRYPLAVAFSYLLFFVCIRLWLSCISLGKTSTHSGAGWIDVPDLYSGPAKTVAPAVRGGGGEFMGAGASGSFQAPAVALADTPPVAAAGAAVEADAPEGFGDAVGTAAGAVGDDSCIGAFIVLIVLTATILASGFFLLYGAPAILAEAAFQGMLAASLVRRTHAIGEQGWEGSVFKHTWKPFAGTLAIAVISGMVLHSYYPHAVRLTDILWKG